MVSSVGGLNPKPLSHESSALTTHLNSCNFNICTFKNYFLHLKKIVSLCFIFFRNLRSFFALFFLDTSLPGNQETISIIRKEVLSSSIIEAFLESAPQFILQCSIVLRTGIISEFYIIFGMFR